MVKIVSGVLEHVLFELLEKQIEYDMKIYPKDVISNRHGIIIRIPKDITIKPKLIIFIYKNNKMVSYYISEQMNPSQKRSEIITKKKSISKVNLLQKIKELE